MSRESDTSSVPVAASRPRRRRQLLAPTQRRSWFSLRRLGLFFGWLMVGLSLVGLIAFGLVYAYYSHLASEYDLSKLGAMPERTVVYDRNGEVVGRLYGENRITVPLAEVSPHFVKAIVAREDSRFYQHSGLDLVGVGRAMVRNIKEGQVVQGASTITMQLARNSFPGLDDRSFHRKLIEIMLARRIEKIASKDQILSHYFNRIFFGNGLYGIQRAANVYFGKNAAELSLPEAALIAGIVRGPQKFSPFKNWEGAKLQRNDVLERMRVVGSISAAEADAARNAQIALKAQPAFRSQGDYAMDAVRRDLDVILEKQNFEDGGLKVYTTLDMRVQTTAEDALEARATKVEATKGYPRITKAQFDATWDKISEVPATPYLQGAVCAIENRTGGIVAIVGGREYRQSKYNRALQGERQIGSTIKPFVYASAISRGLLPGTLIDDSPLPGSWSPGNSDGKFIGPQPMAVGLIQSRNTMTVRIGDEAGLDNVLALMQAAGIGQKIPRTRQVFIGNAGSSLKQMTSAFTVFPNGGVRARPYLIDRIVDRSGEIVYATPPLELPTLSPGVASLTSRLLGLALDHGTAASARSEFGFKAPAGGKTGTTNDFKDAWFIGYGMGLTCGVWMGCDKPETIMEDAYGGKLAVPVWCDVMRKAEALGYLNVATPEQPSTRVKLCRNSSLLATPACDGHHASYEDVLPYEVVPQAFCPVHGIGGYQQQMPGRTDLPRSSQPGLWDRVRGWFGG
jgi:penicillin-binding protein 1A